MALYHFSIDQVRRSAGQSAIAAAAYRAGRTAVQQITTGRSATTQKRAASSVRKFSCRPTRRRNFWTGPPSGTPWSRPKSIPRPNCPTASTWRCQNEFSLEKNIALAREFVQRQFVAKGMIADLAVHVPDKEGGIPNPHFHVMTTMRPLNADGSFGAKQRREYVLDENGDRVRDENGNYVFNAVHTTDWHEPETLVAWREAWCNLVNAKFEEKGLDCRIDHRSYVRQGLDLIPTVHEGPNVRKWRPRALPRKRVS